MSSLLAEPRWPPLPEHAEVAPCIVNNSAETMKLRRRSITTAQGCGPEAAAAALACGHKKAGGVPLVPGRRNFDEYFFLEDSLYTSQRETIGPHRPLPRLRPNSGVPEFGCFIDWPKSETPTSAGGTGRGKTIMKSVSRRPLPNPPPQAGEGADRTFRSPGFHFAEIRLAPVCRTTA
jgi:hypothetical protein